MLVNVGTFDTIGGFVLILKKAPKREFVTSVQTVYKITGCQINLDVRKIFPVRKSF